VATITKPFDSWSGSETITFTATDPGNASSNDNATFSIGSINNPPSFTKGPDQVVDEDAGEQTISGWASDISPGAPDESDQTLTFHTNNDNNSLFSSQPEVDATSGDLSFTPAPDSSGSATVTVYLTDDGGTAGGGDDESEHKTFNITINPINDSPVSNDTTLAVNENRSYPFQENDFPYHDIENDPMKGIKLVSSVKKGQLTYDGNQVSPGSDYHDVTKLIFTPDENQTGSPYTSFDFKIMDSKGAYSNRNYTFQIDVLEENNPPRLTSKMPDTTINEGVRLSWIYQAIDYDYDILNYGILDTAKYSETEQKWLKIEGLEGINIKSSTGVFKWNTNYNQAGKYRIVIYVSDGEAITSDTTIIVINNKNQKPKFTKVLPDTVINNNSNLMYNYKAFDPDGDEISFGLPDESSYLTIGISLSKRGLLTWQIPEQPRNKNKIVVYVTDNVDTVETSAKVKVNDVVAITDNPSGRPEKYFLSQSYPNPFNPSTTIKYCLPEASEVNISIFNSNGKLVKTLVDTYKNPGYYRITWKPRDIPTGVYFYRIKAGKFVKVKKCLFLK
jgi:hypothetical protein